MDAVDAEWLPFYESAVMLDATPFFLSCGKYCVGQTSRCVNVRLREHDNRTKLEPDSFHTLHTVVWLSATL